MSKRSLLQISIRNPEFVDPGCLESGTVPWLLARRGAMLFPAWLFKGWRGGKRRGRPAWPAIILAKMLCLRWTGEGMPRTESVEQARHNTKWRAALGLEFGDPTPTEKTLRDFERFLMHRHPDSDTPRYLVLHEHVVRTCLDLGVVGDKAIWATDSTPMFCFGAVQDTVRLLGDGLRSLGKAWARASRTSLEFVAQHWNLDLLLAKSTKGSFSIDWRDREQRASVFDGLARQAIDVVQIVRREVLALRPRKRKGVLRRCRGLLKVIVDDLEVDEEGRLVVARRVAMGRLVSILDPQARHGRKSRSRTFSGFKMHVLGDVVGGLIASVAVTKGNEHDGAPAPRLIRRAKALCDEIEQVLADTAYGGARLRNLGQRLLGVRILSPPPPVTTGKGKLGKEHIHIDFATWTATCAAGETTATWAWSRSSSYDVSVRRFKWPTSVCKACRFQDACCGKRRGGRWIKLHPHERELRAAREDWQDATIRTLYRKRAECERLVNEPIRHGGRQARAFGLGAANLQAHVIVVRCNLGLLARKLAEMESQDKAA
jgi:hypothetical protein